MTPKSTSTCAFTDMNFGNISCSEVYILQDAGRLNIFMQQKGKQTFVIHCNKEFHSVIRKVTADLSVRDTTPGISAENVKNNFAEFYH